MRAIVAAIVVALVLLGGTANVANALPGSGSAVEADDAGGGNLDPGDPGLPPDD